MELPTTPSLRRGQALLHQDTLQRGLAIAKRWRPAQPPFVSKARFAVELLSDERELISSGL
jgi:hypothetical protein